MVIGIIGGGASGMAAALAAAENPGVQVLLFERQARLGRKLQATGNGRCNLTNLHALETGYHGEDAAFADFALNGFSPERTIQWFRSLGLVTVAEPSGRVYPYSDQANSVVDILRFALEKENIQHQQTAACTYRHIRHVEHGEVYGGNVYHVPHIAQRYAIDKIAYGARKQQTDGKLHEKMHGLSLLKEKPYHADHRNCGNDEEKPLASLHHAKSRAAVFHIGKVQHILPHLDIPVERKVGCRLYFGYLIYDQQHNACQS